MTALTNAYNNKPPADGDKAFNVPAVLTGSETYSVEGDSHCGGITYNSSNPPPNGSEEGIGALLADTQGCIDFARSSRGRRPTDPANLDFYAFARDAVTWAGFRGQGTCSGAGDGCAPVNLTQAQLQGIYLCTQGGQPLYTNWNQVGGGNGTIVRYLPQLGSGTLSFFETKILGLGGAQPGTLDDRWCTNRPIRIQENTGNQVAQGFKPYAILPYSYADYQAQASGIVPDVRGGAFLGNINGVAPNAFSITANTFLGTRYVYNVVKQGVPSTERAIDFVGVRASGNGFICSDSPQVQSIISQFGFVPLALGPAGFGLPNSRCRLNPAPL